MTEQTRSLWDDIAPEKRSKLIWWLWLVTWVLLLIGLFDRAFYRHVVTLSFLQLILFFCLFQFRIRPFPIQVRIAYLLWVAIGTYVPGMVIFMYITTIGLASNLFFGYCPLARLIYLLPWNHDEPTTAAFVKQVFFSPPGNGTFTT